MAKHRKKRIPKLLFTKNRGLGFYVAYRDPATGSPRKHRFGTIPREQAVQAYNEWIGAYLTGKTPTTTKHPKPLANTETVAAKIVDGSLLHVVSGLATFDEARLRPEGAARTKGTIGRKQFDSRRDLRGTSWRT